MTAEPWAAALAELGRRGLDALLVTGPAAAGSIGGHRRIGVRGSPPPLPVLVLTRGAPPHVITPDPDGAMHLPPDHVHAIHFDLQALSRAIAGWLGDAGHGVVATEPLPADAMGLLEAACPDARFVDAAPLLRTIGISAAAGRGLRRDPDPLVAARRRRLGRVALDGWILTDIETVRFATGAWTDDDGDAAIVAVGDAVSDSLPGRDDPALVDAILDQLPRSGRIAVDRLGIAARDALGRALPRCEVADASAVFSAARGPYSPEELAVLHDGSLRTEHAVRDVLPEIEVGMTEADVSRRFTDAAARAGLPHPHIEHVWTVIPERAQDAPWRRGEWSGFPPWRQLTSATGVLGVGDRLFLDAGFLHHGYATDFGWTFVVGREPTDAEQGLARRWTDVADRVTEALAPGASAADLTAAALRAWTGPTRPWPFPLYVAHGIGFGGVEAPFAGTDLADEAERSMAIEPGTVVLVEPYVWEEGIGGFRAERCVLVTDRGPEVWTELPVGELRAASA